MLELGDHRGEVFVAGVHAFEDGHFHAFAFEGFLHGAGDAFKAKKEDPSGPFVFPSYSAVEVIAEGIKAAKSEDAAKVAEAIHKGTFKTPTGDLSFDDKGDLKDFKFVVYEWHNGKPKTEVSPQ